MLVAASLINYCPLASGLIYKCFYIFFRNALTHIGSLSKPCLISLVLSSSSYNFQTLLKNSSSNLKQLHCTTHLNDFLDKRINFKNFSSHTLVASRFFNGGPIERLDEKFEIFRIHSQHLQVMFFSQFNS